MAWGCMVSGGMGLPLSIAVHCGERVDPNYLGLSGLGFLLNGYQVVCHSDNQSVVADLRSRTSKHKGMMHLLRCLVFMEAQLQCFLFPTYIDTKANHLADSLSRDDARSFLSKVPSARRHPAPVSTPYWIFSWICRPIGPLRSGASTSKIR